MATRKTTTRSEAELKKAKKSIVAPKSKSALQTKRAGTKTELTLDTLARFPGENPNPVLRVGENGLLLYANRASVPLLKHWVCKNGGTLPPEWKKRINEALSSLKPFSVNEPIGKRIYAMDIVPIKDAGYANVYGRDVTDQKQIELALREGENRYRSLFENMMDGFAFCRMIYSRGQPKDFVYLAVNDAFERLTGLQNVVGKKVSEVIPGIRKSNPELFEIYDRVASGGRPERFESCVESLGIWFSISVFSPQKEHFTAVFENITERKRAEEAVTASQRFLQDITDNSTSLIYALDQQGRFLLINRTLESVLGVPRETLIGKTREAILPPEIAAAHRDNDLKVMNDRQPIAVEEENNESDGKHTYLSMKFPLLDPQGRVYGVGGVSTDITERKREEEALRVLDSRQKAILEAVPDIIMEVDENKVYTWANRPGTEFFGDDVIGMEAQAYFEGEQETYQKVKPLFNGDENTLYVESWQRRRDGQKRLLTWWCRVLKDDNGKVTGALSTARDVTELRRADEALRQSEHRLRRFYESSLIGVIYWNMNGRITDANDKFLEMVGYTRDDLANGSIDWVNMTPPEYRHLDEQSFAELKATGVNRTPLEKEYIRKDGSRIPIIGAGAMLGEERFDGVAFVLDNTDRKRAELDIRKQMEELQRWHDLTLDREIRALELKREVNELLRRLNEPVRYPSVEN